MIKNTTIQKFISLTVMDQNPQFQNIMDISGGMIDWENFTFKKFSLFIECVLPFWAPIKDFGKLKNSINYGDITMRVDN